MPPPGARTARFRTVSACSGGYRAEVTAKNTGTAASPAGPPPGTWEAPRSAAPWNGSATVSAGRAAVRDAAPNGALSPGATTSPGFTADGPTGMPATRCTGP
ncbi:cellulose binding domain-containing protein [Streptomyces sp. NPDC048737]|uniref:cellulose binding domain-containing protein n=1 Tax=unclassified Streptomyces TaxID=2593676 RepID=UPI00344475CC